MTTLSTLIGSTGTPLGLSDLSAAPAKPSLFQRLGGAMKRKPRPAGDVTVPVAALERMASGTLYRDGGAQDESYDDGSLSDSVDEAPGFGHGGSPQPPRRRLLWGGGGQRRDAAMEEVRHSIGALASLLGGIQNHMEQQGARQQELIACLAHLPASGVAQTDALQSIRDQLAWGSAAQAESVMALRQQLADGSAAQADGLAAIRDQMARGTDAQIGTLTSIRDQIAEGSANQSRLSTALERLGGLTETTGAALERLGHIQQASGDALASIGTRIDRMDARDSAFVSSLEKVSDAMRTVSRASEGGAVVLDKVQAALSAQDDGLHRTLDKHQSKFNALMAVAIAVSAAALAVVAGVGYLVLTKI